MNRAKPPAVASWMLQHLARRTTSEALAGDLLEEFTRGRSGSWYWRQVLWAILVTVLGTLRSASLALSFALLWTIGVTLFWGRYFFPSQMHLILRKAPSLYAQFDWPWSTIFEISLVSVLATVPVVAGLSVYILVSRRFSTSRYFLAVSLAFVLQAARTLALPGILKHSRSFSIAIFFAILVLTMWVAQRTHSDRSPAQCLNSGMTPTTLGSANPRSRSR